MDQIIVNFLMEKVISSELVLYNSTVYTPVIQEQNGMQFQTIVPAKSWLLGSRFSLLENYFKDF